MGKNGKYDFANTMKKVKSDRYIMLGPENDKQKVLFI
jgi:hypothetical protein